MSTDGLEALRARVRADDALARRLRHAEPERFAAELTRVACELGLDVTPDDVDAALAAARRDWTLRWTR